MKNFFQEYHKNYVGDVWFLSSKSLLREYLKDDVFF